MQKEEPQVIKTQLDRSQAKDFAQATGTALALARCIDDALVCLKYGLDHGRQALRYNVEQAVRCLMNQERTYAVRLRRMLQEAKPDARMVPEQSPVTPEIVTLCGSTRFKKQFLEMTQKFTHEGKIVLSVGSFPHADEKKPKEELFGEAVSKALVDLHFRKIDISDSIFVINPKLKKSDKHGYIGKSTASEILYALAVKRQVISMEPYDMEAVIKTAGYTVSDKRPVEA